MSEPATAANNNASLADPQSKQESQSADPTPTSSDHANVVDGSIRSTKLNSSSHSQTRRSTFKKRRSSLFELARASFYRTRGQAGASVETLRGNTGASFEGYAYVHRGANGEGLVSVVDCFSCCGFGKEKDPLYYLLIKGYHCFVFKDENGKSPKYAIELENRRAVVQHGHVGFVPRVPHPHAREGGAYTTVHLETSLGDVEYKFTFTHAAEDGDVKATTSRAGAFCDAVAVASNEASTEQVRKRLGHEQLINKRSSVKYANTVGAAKTKEQPEAPLGVGEVLAGMPATETFT